MPWLLRCKPVDLAIDGYAALYPSYEKGLYAIGGYDGFYPSRKKGLYVICRMGKGAQRRTHQKGRFSKEGFYYLQR